MKTVVNDENNIVISDIYWDKIYLHIGLTGATLGKQEFVIADRMNKYLFPVKYDENTLEIVINITNIGHKHMLGNNIWYVKYRNISTWNSRTDNNISDEWNDIPITTEVGYSLKNLDKIYRYSSSNYAYTFTFEPSVINDVLICAVNCSFMVKNNDLKKRYFKIESNNRSARLKKRLIYSLEVVINGIYQIAANITPKKGNRVLLMSESRCPMNGNLKALDDRLKERGLDKQFKISYHFQNTLENNRAKIFFIWFKLALLTAKQDYIFIDDYAPFFNFTNLHPKTTLIQVWHAGVGFKNVGYAKFGSEGSPKPTETCYRKCDYAIVGTEALRDVYAEVFGIDRENCLPYGLMRLDDYLNPKKIESFKEKFYEQYPNLKGKKIILFAPTFRGPDKRTAYYPYDMLDMSAIYDMCGDEYVFLIKNHPYVSEAVDIPPEYSKKILDFSAFPDINDLFYVTDILITDYSSNIYEFSLQKKPMIFFAFDKELYELTRGIHRTLDRYAPGKVCSEWSEVLDAIKNQDFETEKLYRFLEENFDSSDGYAADKVIDGILLNDNADD